MFKPEYFLKFQRYYLIVETYNIGKAVSLRLYELLSEKNMTIYKLYKNSGLDRDNVYNLVRGKNADVKLSTLEAICETIGISLEEFFRSKYFRS